MIHEKDWQELCPELSCSGEQSITLQTIQNALFEYANANNIPVAFSSDKVKRGGILGQTEDCLVIYHPDHKKDYFSIAICIKQLKGRSVVSVNSFGTSKRLKAETMRKQVLSTAKVGWNRVGTPYDYNTFNDAISGAAFVGAAAVGLRNLVKGKDDKAQIEMEEQWYMSICGIVEEVVTK